MAEVLEAVTAQDQLKSSGSPVPVDVGLEAVNKCLAAASYGLKFDIAELWRFAPNAAMRSSGLVSGNGGGVAGAGQPAKPTCEHVYAQPATLKTYTGRIVGIWNSGFDDSRAPQQHVLSPSVREIQKRVLRTTQVILRIAVLFYNSSTSWSVVQLGSTGCCCAVLGQGDGILVAVLHVCYLRYALQAGAFQLLLTSLMVGSEPQISRTLSIDFF